MWKKNLKKVPNGYQDDDPVAELGLASEYDHHCYPVAELELASEYDHHYYPDSELARYPGYNPA